MSRVAYKWGCVLQPCQYNSATNVISKAQMNHQVMTTEKSFKYTLKIRLQFYGYVAFIRQDTDTIKETKSQGCRHPKSPKGKFEYRVHNKKY